MHSPFPSHKIILLLACAISTKLVSAETSWQSQLSGASSPSKKNGVVASSDGTLWITTMDGYLHILNAENGEEMAVHEPFGGVVGPCHSKAVLYEEDGKTIYGVYALNDGRVFAVNPDGKQRWLAVFDNSIPRQPTIDLSGKKVYVTLNFSLNNDDDSELAIIDDEKSSMYGIGTVERTFFYNGQRFGSAAMIQRKDSTSVVFGSYAAGESSFGSLFKYNINDETVTELAYIGRNVMAPPVLNKAENKLWLTASNPKSVQAEIFGWVEGSFSENSFWYADLGEDAKHVHHAPLLSKNEQFLYVTSDRAVYKVDADNGVIIWKVNNLNICSQPVLSPNNDYLFVLEEIGGRVWKIDTRTGRITMEHNCSNPGECLLHSSADIAISPNSNSIYFTYENGVVMAAKVFDVETVLPPTPLTMPPSQAPSLAPSKSLTFSLAPSIAPTVAPTALSAGEQFNSNETNDMQNHPVHSKRFVMLPLLFILVFILWNHLV